MSTKETTKQKQDKPAQKRPHFYTQEEFENAARLKNFIKIKPEIDKFIGGSGIPDWVRESDLYVSRVNPNGTITIANSQNLCDIDALFQRDVVILDEKRVSKDTVTECPNVSIRIFGVPERMECIKENQKRLGIPDEQIFIDKNHEGVIPTAKRAWSYQTDKEFTLVLQDDVELCDDFMNYVNKIVEAQPNAIIALYPVQFSSRNSINRIPSESPYVSTTVLTGQGIIMRTEWVEKCLAEWKDEYTGDDTNIGIWAKNNNVRIITLLPAIIQHIGDISVFDSSRSIGKTYFYKKNPADANWENSYITNACNILR